ncbi:MAG: type II toxin-antitoxin system PemK/MazF family toxin [Sulfurimonas sp.]|nr:type II toxin-antitoxin system PemK/MazF family toxin [Sulfurimonas sp.]
MKNFDDWNVVKKQVDSKSEIITYKERDIFWVNLGENVGFEQNGKDTAFLRPVVVIRKFSKNLFFGVPLSTSTKDGNFFYQFSFIENKISTALLVQAKTFDVKRLERRIGMIGKRDFEIMKEKLKDLIFLPQK